MHLLVIEDERALCETIVRSLRRLAYSVDYCYDGEKALELRDALARDFMVDYDEAGSIGKRYRRQDEIGTPFCITVDFQTVGDDKTEADHCVTVRDRDTMEQVRIPIDQVKAYIAERVKF